MQLSPAEVTSGRNQGLCDQLYGACLYSIPFPNPRASYRNEGYLGTSGGFAHRAGEPACVQRVRRSARFPTGMTRHAPRQRQRLLTAHPV